MRPQHVQRVSNTVLWEDDQNGKGEGEILKKDMQLVWNLLQHFVIDPTSLVFLTQPFLLTPLTEELKWVKEREVYFRSYNSFRPLLVYSRYNYLRLSRYSKKMQRKYIKTHMCAWTHTHTIFDSACTCNVYMFAWRYVPLNTAEPQFWFDSHKITVWASSSNFYSYGISKQDFLSCIDFSSSPLWNSAEGKVSRHHHFYYKHILPIFFYNISSIFFPMKEKRSKIPYKTFDCSCRRHLGLQIPIFSYTQILFHLYFSFTKYSHFHSNIKFDMQFMLSCFKKPAFILV